MSIFEKSFKKDLENFEYDKREIPQEHKWDMLASGEMTKKFYEEKEKIYSSRFKRNRVQSNPETTGQHSPID